MRETLFYLRKHPWQARAVIFTGSAVLVLALTLLFKPTVSYYLLLRDLRNPGQDKRERAIRHAAWQAQTSDDVRRRLERSLDTDNDRQFLSIASALTRVNRFCTADRPGEQIDRFAALQFEVSINPTSRWLTLHAQCLVDRVNSWQRRLLAKAVADENEEIRLLAAVLAAKMGDDNALRALLSDSAAEVRAGAAIDAALARRSGVMDALAACLDDPDEIVSASAAHALAMLDPADHSDVICRKLLDAADPDARDRYLLAAMILDDDNARGALRQCFRRVTASDRVLYADAMLLRAAAAVKADWAEGAIRDVLSAAARLDGKATNLQLLAALLSAEELRLPVRHEVYNVVRNAWGWESREAMVTAARVLARQAGSPQSDPKAPDLGQCVQVLRQAVMWEGRTDNPDDNEPPTIWRTPMASAAATVGLWELRTQLTNEFIEQSVCQEESLPDDYVAWHVTAIGPPADAYALGERMLPPAESVEDRVYNDQMRATGAMLLALSARTDAQNAEARKRLTDRLTGIGLGAEKDPYLRHAYQCALLILGDRSVGEDIYTCTGILELPQWRTMTSLLIAGDRRVLDWALWNPQFPPEVVVDLLVGRHLDDVVKALVPRLPRIDPGVPHGVRLWQAKILRDAYAIHRASVEIAPWPPTP